MFKQIPKSNISQKNFKVYKEWSVTNATIPVIEAYNETGLFDLETSTQSQGLYVHPLFNSIKSKYYSSYGNLVTQYGMMKNPANWSTERYINSRIDIIQIPQIQYGEQIKKGSVVLNIDGDSETYVDNNWGGLVTQNPTYMWISYDTETQELVIDDGNSQYLVIVSQFDVNSGIGWFVIDGVGGEQTVFQMDAQTGFITLSNELLFTGGDPMTAVRGNVFYDDGLIISTNLPEFTDYTLTYKSVQTLYETEVLVSAVSEEFNTSQNPTAVEVILNSTSSFDTTAITNYKPAGTVIIKDVLDIRKKQEFYGSGPLSGSQGIIAEATGSWDDYYDYGTTDPTGSYLSTYITTIGLYDDNMDMVAVAKLPKPIKKLPDYNLNFIIRFDT
jgi:hypothetical protein